MSTVSEYVVCAVCAVKYHFNCSIREAKWRNMTPDQRSKWACVKCKTSKNLSRTNSAGSSLSEVDNGSTGDEELTTRALLLKMNARLDTLDHVKESVDVMSTSMQFFSERYDELLEEIKGFKEVNKRLNDEIDLLKSNCSKKDEELAALTLRFNSLEQYGRGNNLEIHGIEEADYETDESILEKTAKALGVTYSPSEVQAAHRVPSRDKTRTPMFLVQFVSKAIKQRWLLQGKKRKLQSKNIVGTGEQRVYFNDNLTPYYSRLLRDTKKLAKERGYEYVWVLNGTIRAKKNADSRLTLMIRSDDDLKRLV